MNPICSRCALRLQRAATSDSIQAGRRAFSQTITKRKGGVPAFTKTSSPELDAKLADIRAKHFIPAYLNHHDRRLIFGTKHKQSLEDNPQTATIGKEEIDLNWIDRRSEVPNGKKLVKEIINLSAEHDEWQNLPNLLVGLKHSRHTPSPERMEEIIRKAVEQGRIGIIVQCLQQAERTGMTLRTGKVMRSVMWGLHQTAQMDNWSEESVTKALKNASQVALLLETEVHSTGGSTGSSSAPWDAKRRPENVAVFLELEAVNAYKFHNGVDVNGKVKMYAERLLKCIGDIPEKTKPRSHAPAPRGPQFEMLHGVPIWHGLTLAQKILSPNMPQAEFANQIIAEYQTSLSALAKAIEEKSPKEGTYNAQALSVWKDCIRD
ncbi:Hypothetical protein R9X50_00114900 [Acrodontium crateriforme]|uniref:Uncharacterized protein n=1 Tax=Acrodontium crateriforme TaxID=150365 RepID=A0AAQ3M1Y0_9PEZI|nr:Hypothetical protein R9X50_00114900 [Acrodontium crateriforme]